jgi:hypothetical protein
MQDKDGYKCKQVTEGDALLVEESGPKGQAMPRQPRALVRVAEPR